jgi:hypothetical protein
VDGDQGKCNEMTCLFKKKNSKWKISYVERGGEMIFSDDMQIRDAICFFFWEMRRERSIYENMEEWEIKFGLRIL